VAPFDRSAIEHLVHQVLLGEGASRARVHNVTSNLVIDVDVDAAPRQE